MTMLPKLDALLKAAEDATPRPWKYEHLKPHYDIRQVTSQFKANPPFARTLMDARRDLTGVENAAYIVQAANAAPDMARLLKRAHAVLDDKDVCAGTDMPGDPCAACELVDEIEARFGEEETT